LNLRLCDRPRKIDEEVSDHEEEFYYTEVEECDVDDDENAAAATNVQSAPLPPTNEVSVVTHSAAPTAIHNYAAAPSIHPGLMASSPPTLSHMDMARPPHEGNNVQTCSQLVLTRNEFSTQFHPPSASLSKCNSKIFINNSFRSIRSGISACHVQSSTSHCHTCPSSQHFLVFRIGIRLGKIYHYSYTQ
jgi:hypothetical protein